MVPRRAAKGKIRLTSVFTDPGRFNRPKRIDRLYLRRIFMPRWVHAVLRMAAIAAGLVAATAQAQQYPNRPVRVIVGFAAGSGPDVLARAVANQLTADL